MRRLIAGLCVAALASTAAVAASDPIPVRKSIMDAVGAAAALSGGMMKGDIPYSPTAGKAAIMSFNGSAHAFGAFFPEGSESGDTTAAPAIWEDAAGFQEALTKFVSSTEAAAAASGKEGPADLDAFKAAVGPVMQNCRSCHQTYRVR